MTVRVEPATARCRGDVVAVLGGRNPKPNSCWCHRFRAPGEASEMDALQHELDRATVPIGLLVHVDDHPAGWSRVARDTRYPGSSATGG